MGVCLSSEPEGISFNPRVRGQHISWGRCLHHAERCHSFQNGLLFSDRPLRPQEKLWVRIVKDDPRWYGGLRLGFTSVDPDSLNPAELPPFACPNLTILNGYWAICIPEELSKIGALISFWVNRKGQALCQRKEDPQPIALFDGLPRNMPLWAIVDVYGQTKAVQLIDSCKGKLPCPCTCLTNKVSQSQTVCRTPNGSSYTCGSSPSNSNMTSHSESLHFPLYLEDDPYCVICQDSTSDTMLVPCGHCCFCKSCALKVHEQNSSCPLCRRTIHCLQNVDPV
ncbi:E3 ubiquitin-protein ligase NEURL3 [Pelobates fuscus]|uniref:E3 ubiquitin-protein ligase NEURL3 n=1 Tax=Pelobates fuscus TaxID=191477 RepID=UPI002FE46593